MFSTRGIMLILNSEKNVLGWHVTGSSCVISIFTQTGNTTLIGQVFNVDTACAVDFINWLSLNKRGMNSLNVLRARSWDGFHKQITQVVHVCEREWSAG